MATKSRLTFLDTALGEQGYVTTDVLIAAAENKDYRRAQVAALYAVAIAYDSGHVEWPAANKAILERWSLAGLEWIKQRAWAGVKANGHGQGTASPEFE